MTEQVSKLREQMVSANMLSTLEMSEDQQPLCLDRCWQEVCGCKEKYKASKEVMDGFSMTKP